MRPVLALLLLAILPVWATAQQLEPPLKRGKPAIKTVEATAKEAVRPKLEIAVYAWPPFASPDLPHFGIAPHLASEALRVDDTQIHYQFMHWSKALDKLYADEIDGAIIWASPDMNLDAFTASRPLLLNTSALFYRKDTPFNAEISTLGNVRMAWIKEYVYEGNTYQKLIKHQLTPVAAKNEIDALRMVIKKQSDVFLAPYSLGRDAMDKLTDSERNSLQYTTQKTPFPATFFLINAERPDGSELMKKFNTELTRMQQDGRYDRITESLP
ncbi:MAG TPA: transporter substrate-binding domain-containing protein [Pseudomonadales bacterium]|nr:transporter substrate-binding domain-containing protein [Pseudomonadales bacterium]